MIPVWLAALAITFVTPDNDPARVTVRATGLTGGETLTLHRAAPTDPDGHGPAIFASASHPRPGVLELRPAFGLGRGDTYIAVLRASSGKELEREIHEVPPPESGSAPELTAIYPQADVLPANLLKFYLQFSRPMRQEIANFDRIHLEDSEGKRIHAPWRRQELWTADATRLTLWIHPGRVKQGVNLREELGPVLEPGREYTLIVEKSLLSEAGTPLNQEVRKTYRTMAEDHERPLPESWELTVPQAGTRQPLIVRAGEPLDHALVERHITLVEPDGGEVKFDWDIAQDASSWKMIPAGPWRDAEYHLQIGERLEDLGGNTPVRVFDTDLTAPEPAPPILIRAFRPSSS